MFVFRKIENKTWWSADREQHEDWLPLDDLRADTFRDFRTTQNALSVFFLNDIAQQTIDRVVVACAAGRNSLHQVDYVVIAEDMVRALPVDIEEVPGKTLDSEVNAWHRDLSRLTARRLLEMAVMLSTKGAFARRSQKEVGRLMNAAIDAGVFSRDSLDKELVQKLADAKFSPQA